VQCNSGSMCGRFGTETGRGSSTGNCLTMKYPVLLYCSPILAGGGLAPVAVVTGGHVTIGSHVTGPAAVARSVLRRRRGAAPGAGERRGSRRRRVAPDPGT
jgi:hypothetical protein